MADTSLFIKIKIRGGFLSGDLETNKHKIECFDQSLYLKKKKLKKVWLTWEDLRPSPLPLSLFYMFFLVFLYISVVLWIPGEGICCLGSICILCSNYNVLLCKFYFIATLVSQHASLGGGAYLDLDILWVIDRLEGSVV